MDPDQSPWVQSAEDLLTSALDNNVFNQLSSGDEDTMGQDMDQHMDEQEAVPKGVDPGPVLEPGWSLISDRHGLLMSPGGSIHSRYKATSDEDLERQHQDFLAWSIENGLGMGNEQNDWSVPGIASGQRRWEPVEDDDPDNQDGTGTKPQGRKRREASVVKCHYIGCERVIDQAPLTCPHHETGQPDLIHPFCCYECMMAWALYEIGDPLADALVKGINHRAGHKVLPAPSWYDTIIMGVGRLKMAGQADSKGIRLEEDTALATGHRTHEARLLPDNATIEEGDMVEPMDDPDEPDPHLDQDQRVGTPVPCRLCNAHVDSREAALRVRLHTAAIWAFCSESCAMDHPYAKHNGLMTLTEWLELSRKGQAVLLHQSTWGSERDDVDPDTLGPK